MKAVLCGVASLALYAGAVLIGDACAAGSSLSEGWGACMFLRNRLCRLHLSGGGLYTIPGPGGGLSMTHYVSRHKDFVLSIQD